MAEIELSVQARQCLKERMETRDNIEQQVKAWQQQSNASNSRVDWRF